MEAGIYTQEHSLYISYHYPRFLNQSGARLLRDPEGGCLLKKLMALIYGAVHTEPLGRFHRHFSRVVRYIVALLEFCEDLGIAQLWQLTHLTPALIWYMLAQGADFGALPSTARGLPPAPRAVRRQLRVPRGSAIWDLGAADGADTMFYLHCDAALVLAVEPAQVEVGLLQERLAAHVAAERLVLLPRAVVHSSDEDSGPLPFAVSKRNPNFNQLVLEVGIGLEATYKVEVVSCRSLLRQFGRPFFVKVDTEAIKGAGHPCLRDLCSGGTGALPRYVSVELDATSADLQLLRACGYDRFKLASQALFNIFRQVSLKELRDPRWQRRHRKFMVGAADVPRFGGGRSNLLRQSTASGPFGEAAVDLVRGPRWRTYAQTVAMLAFVEQAQRGGHDGRNRTAEYEQLHGQRLQWFDLHARLRRSLW